jgi:hypothetical protein
MAAYATSADLINFADENSVKDLLSDTGTYTGTLSTDTKLTALLQAASGAIEAACGVSELYNPTDLAALAGNSLVLLKELVCQLTMVLLVRRRPEKYGSEYWQAIRKEAEDYLDRLRKGERLFDDSHKRLAGLPTIDGPTSIDYQRLNLLPSRTRNFFPSVGQRLPLGRG